MTKLISRTVWSQTSGPGGPPQVAERQTFEFITSCCAGLESSQKETAAVNVEETCHRALTVKKMERQNINPLNKSTQKYFIKSLNLYGM